MSDKLQKPYEISLWEDVLVNEDGKTYYKEVKIATIGSDVMTAPSRVFDPIFTQNVNGEITLTFSIVHKYYDEVRNEYVTNYFERFLVNERKLKLYYDNEWYDFVLKTCDENSDSNTINYTAKGLFVNELGKVGYSIVLSNDLKNNQGTIFDLAKKAVKGTDWVIDKENSDIIRQYVAEPIYAYKNNVEFTAIDLLTKEEITIEAGETLFIFYSAVANSQEENVFFLRKAEFSDETTLDDNNVAQMTNYRFKDTTPAVYDEEKLTIKIGAVELTREITDTNSTGINYDYQGYRLAYNPQTGYDTIKERPVELYQATYDDGSTKTVYKYTDYEYVTSDVVINCITNGSNFNIYDNGSMEGWSAATPSKKVPYKRAVQDLKINENIIGKISIPSAKIETLFANLQVYLRDNLSQAVDVPNEGKTFTYNIKTIKTGGISPTEGTVSFTYVYNNTPGQEKEALQITVSFNGSSEEIEIYSNQSTDVEINISDIGLIAEFSSVPQISTIQQDLITAMSDCIFFVTPDSDEGKETYGKYELQPLDLVTYPQIDTTSLLELTTINEIKNYLRTKFRDVGNRENGYSNSIYNSGIGEYREEIHSFSKGEEYVFRISYGVSSEEGEQPRLTDSDAGKIKAIVAKYTMESTEVYNTTEKKDESIYVYKPDKNNILFKFDGDFIKRNNTVEGGYFRIDEEGRYATYYKDGVSVTPSVDYIYVEKVEDGDDIEKVWNPKTNFFVAKDESFLDYYYTIATCLQPVSNTVLAETGGDYGIFLYIDDPEYVGKYFYIKDAQFFKKKLDGNGDIVLIGNTPKATAISTDFFYLQPESDTEENSIETYSTLEALASSLGLEEEDIKPVYNEDFEKISSIEASQSNSFNIIQDLCEAFECWAKFEVDHEENGAIRLDSDGAPSKKITFHIYSGDDNFAGFKYGINLESIQRTFESEEFVSKLIVEQVENDTVDGGLVTIAEAPSNPSGESYIINMSYYLNHELIENPQQYYVDYNTFVEKLKNINKQYNLYKAQLQLATLAKSKVVADVNVYTNLVKEAEQEVTKVLSQFKELTGLAYKNYVGGNGYTIEYILDGSSSRIIGKYSKMVSSIVPSFFDATGEEILMDEFESSETEEGVITKIYTVSDKNNTSNDVAGDNSGDEGDEGGEETPTTPLTIDKVKYICISSRLDGFDIIPDGNYSSYRSCKYFEKEEGEPLADIISQLTTYIWNFNGANPFDQPGYSAPKAIRLTLNPTKDNETLISLIGEIYTYQQTINNYTPLIQRSNDERKELEVLINGTKDYSLTVSTTSTLIGGVEYDVTKEFLDDYIDGLKFTLTNSNGTEDVEPTITEKFFSQDEIYNTITFISYPNNYQLKYILDGEELTTKSAITLKIPLNGKRVFTLIPIEEQQGLKDLMTELLDQKDEVEAEFYKKYSRYIQEGSWTSQDYIDNELYYLDALNVSATSAQPKASYNLAVYEISEQEGLENYNFKAGDKTYIEDVQFFGYQNKIFETTNKFVVENNMIVLPESTTDVISVYRDFDHYIRNYSYNSGDNSITFYIPEDEEIQDKPPVVDGEELYVHYSYAVRTPVREEVVVSEVEWHLDDVTENTITIQNYKTQFDDLFQRMAAAVQSVEYNSASYSRAASILDQGGFINAGLLLKSLNEIAGGFSLSGDNTITASEDGIIVKDLLDPLRQMKIAGAGLKTSLDGGYNWNTIVTAEGIVIDTIDTQNVIIKDGDNPSFRWDKYGLNAYGFDSEKTDLKTYVRLDKYGLYGVKNGENFQAESLDDIKDTAQFGLLWDGFFIKNSYTDGYVSISSDEDFQVVANDQERIKIGALEKTADGYHYGIRIKNSSGNTVFTTDDSGNIEMTGIVNATGGVFTESISVGSSDNSIILKGTNDDAIIGSSQYFADSSKGWAIKADGDAVFNNITARGAIKTAVFEYSEIEAVGGIFLFRPSSTIKKAEIPIESTPIYEKVVPEGESPEDYELDSDEIYYVLENEEYIEVEEPVIEDIDNYYIMTEDSEIEYSSDLLLEVENPLLFRIGDWCKVSNYTPEDPTSSLSTSGLVNIFEVISIDGKTLTLQNGATMFQNIINPTTVIPDEEVSAIGVNNLYTLTDTTSEDPIENLTDRYFYDILIIDDNSEDVEWFATGAPTTLTFTDGNVNYLVTYLGNLFLWNQDEQYRTEEDYLFITINNETQLYVGEGNKYYSESGNNENISLLFQRKFELSYEVDSLVGGALLSFANYPTSMQVPQLSGNYGIGINSSDSAVNLPARAISLFESEIYPNEDVKVGYKFKGILGTLPNLGTNYMDSTISNYMSGTQGIYTNNMYIGDASKFISFYTDDHGETQLRIRANQIVFEAVDPDTHEPTGEWHDVNQIETEGVPGPPGSPGEDAIYIYIEPTAGNIFINNIISTKLVCHVYKGGLEITNDPAYLKTYIWTKQNADGNIDRSWIPTPAALEPNAINISAQDVNSRAIFICQVNIEEA